MGKFDLTRDRSAVSGKYEFSFIGNAQKAIVPVLQYRSGRYRIIGTASYFGEPNWLITAQHIFRGDDIADTDGFAVYFDGTSEPMRLDAKYDLQGTDVTLCRLEGGVPPSIGDVTPFRVMNLAPEVHEVVAAFGYSHSSVNPNEVFEDEDGELLQSLRFRAKWELGGVLAIHPEGRGHVKSECFETSILAEGRDSGAPIFNSNGFLVGILSSSFEFESGLPNSTFTSIVRIGGFNLGDATVSDIWYKGQRSVYCKKL